MIHARTLVAVLFLVWVWAPSAQAIDPGKAAGTMSVDGSTATLAHAAQSTAENLFDSSKRDTIIVLTDRPLGDTAPDDEIALSMKARSGDLSVLSLRFDGSRLVNVRVMFKGISGEIILPGAWFQFAAAGKTAGTLKLAKKEWDGHAYAASVEFSAGAMSRPAPKVEAPAPPVAPPPRAVAPPAAAPVVHAAATASNDAKPSTALLVDAMMRKNVALALDLITRGADPNGRDQYGTPVLNWAVMTCQPEVVSALVKAKASLTYQRAPGMTILTEAGACPSAEKILRAAGAR